MRQLLVDHACRQRRHTSIGKSNTKGGIQKIAKNNVEKTCSTGGGFNTKKKHRVADRRNPRLIFRIIRQPPLGWPGRGNSIAGQNHRGYREKKNTTTKTSSKKHHRKNIIEKTSSNKYRRKKHHQKNIIEKKHHRKKHHPKKNIIEKNIIQKGIIEKKTSSKRKHHWSKYVSAFSA